MSLQKTFINTILKKSATEVAAIFTRKAALLNTATNIWKLSPEAKTVNCIITNTKSVQKERISTPLYNREDSISQGLVVSEIERLFSNKIEANYLMSPETFMEGMSELRDNLVLIGGSVNNSISRELLSGTVCKNLNLHFDLGVENRDLHYGSKNDDDRVFTPKQQKNGNFLDYGVILNIKNPWSTSNRLIAIMGCNGLGTYGAAKYIKSGRLMKQKKREIKHLDEYAILICCTGLWTDEALRLNAGDIHFEELIPLNTLPK